MGFREEVEALVPQAMADHQEREAQRLADQTTLRADQARQASEESAKLVRARELGSEVVAYLLDKGVPGVPVIKRNRATRGIETETGRGWHYERLISPGDVEWDGYHTDWILTDEGLTGWVFEATQRIVNPRMDSGDRALQTLQSQSFRESIAHLVATGTFLSRE